MTPDPTPDEIAITRDGERFTFACPPGGETELLARLGPLVRDPDCPLTWFDAARLCHKLRGRLAERIADVEADQAA